MQDIITQNTETIRNFLISAGYFPLSYTKPSYKWIIVASKNENREFSFYYEVTTRYANRKKLFSELNCVSNEELINLFKVSEHLC